MRIPLPAGLRREHRTEPGVWGTIRVLEGRLRYQVLDPASEPIYTQDWATAIRAFSSAALRDTRNADIQNYLGFAYRRSGQLKAAFKHYEQALALNPRHRGAHEYVGEAFLGVGDLAKAEEHLAALERICLLPCEELDDLKEEIEQYKVSLKR